MGRTMKLTVLAVVLTCIMLPGLVLSAGKPKAQAAAKEPYKIGGLFSVTGASSFLGDPEKKSLEMAVELINAKGGIDGHKLEAVIYDDEGDPTKAVQFTNKLISTDKVLAIVGPSLTPTTMPLLPIVEQAKVPLISCAAGNKITSPIGPWVFKTAQTDTLAVTTIYKYMKKQGIKKIGILCVDNAFGQSGREQLKEQAPKMGITVVADEKFGGEDTDMTPQLTKIKVAKPQAVVCWGTNPGPAVVARNAMQIKLGIPLYMSHGVASPKFIELAKEAAEGIILPTGNVLVAKLLAASHPQKAGLDAYVSKYTEKYKANVSGFGGYAWDAMKILELALAGTNGDREKLRKNIEKLTGYVGVSGTFKFSASDHNGLGDDAFSMVRIKKGTWELIPVK